jgi:hypothetical protein
MKFKDVETTFICQFSKPNNKQMLEGYKARKDRSPKELANYYKDIICALADTPAWGVSGVNKMVNELTDAVRATLTKAKKGKTSAPAHANKLLTYIAHFSNEEAKPCYNGRYKLAPILTAEELLQLEAQE